MYVDCIVLYMMTDTKLRSFNVENPNIYQRFKQIQLERGKTSTQRLNELIAKDVKEADPQFKELAAVRSKDAPDVIMPNPLQLDQAHAGIVWREFLMTLTKKQHTEIYQVISCVKDVTYEFDEWVDRD